jgi:hypothetical protein
MVATSKPKAAKKSKTPAKHSQKSGGSGANKRILGCMLSLEGGIGFTEVPRREVFSLAGVAASTFPSVLSKLKKDNLIVYSSSTTIRLTAKGREMADPADAPSDNYTVQQNLKTKYLKGQAGALFDAMMDGTVHDRTVLGNQVGCSIATLPSLISKMKKKGIVVTPDPTSIQLADLCFPYGRP